MAKRRANNEGALFYSDYEECWIAEITLPNGRRRRKRSKKQKVVKDWLLKQRTALQEGRLLPDENITVAEYLDRFMNDVAAHTLRPSSIQSYGFLIRDHIKPEIGHIKLASLRPDHLQSLYSLKLESGLSKRTVQYIHSVIRRALNQAVKWGLLYRNPTAAVTPPKPKKKTPKTLTAEQVKQFFNAVSEHRYYPIYVIAVTMGLRKSEILGLRWQDVDLDQGTVSINHIVTEIQGVIHTGRPKTESSRRTVAMPDVVREVLQEHREATDGTEGLVLTTSSGRAISQRNLTRHFHAALEDAGLEKMRFHDLRHTAATLLLKENVHPKIVQELLGHSSITLTLDTYSHVIPSMQQEAADKMDDLFGGL